MKRLTIEEDIEISKIFIEDLKKFLEETQLTLMDVSYIFDLPNKTTPYQWLYRNLVPYYFIFRCLETWPNHFESSRYFNAKDARKKFDAMMQLKASRNPRKLKYQPAYKQRSLNDKRFQAANQFKTSIN